MAVVGTCGQTEGQSQSWALCSSTRLNLECSSYSNQPGQPSSSPYRRPKNQHPRRHLLTLTARFSSEQRRTWWVRKDWTSPLSCVPLNASWSRYAGLRVGVNDPDCHVSQTQCPCTLQPPVCILCILANWFGSRWSRCLWPVPLAHRICWLGRRG